MLTNDQIKLLQSYRDKSYVSAILCDESSSFYSFLKSLVNVPLVLSSTIMGILNSSDFDSQQMRIPNSVLNASTSLILLLINNFKLPEKTQNFHNKAVKFNKLTHIIEDMLTNDIEDISVDKIRSIINDYDAINETLDYSFPSHIKNRVKKRYMGKKILPNILNCELTFIEVEQLVSPKIKAFSVNNITTIPPINEL